MNTDNQRTRNVAGLKPDEDEPKVRRFLKEVIDRARIPGISVAMNVNGTTLEASSGISDARSIQPMTPDMHFELGCLNKFLTAIVTLELVSEGRIELDQVISYYLPDLQGANGDRIRIRHLLSHTAGYQNENLSDPDIQQDYCYEDFATAFNHRPMHFEPGAVFNYSHSAPVILARIVESLCSREAGQLIQEMIFDPLGIETTQDEHPQRCVRGHLLHPDTAELILPFTVEWCEFWRNSLGGPWITMRDLVKIGSALVEGRIFSEQTRQLLLSHQVRLPGRHLGSKAEHPFFLYGLGCARYPDGSYGVRTHSAGQCCGLRFDPDRGTVVAVGINMEAPHIRDTCIQKLTESLLSEDGSCLQGLFSSVNGNLDPEQLCGLYRGEDNVDFSISHSEEQLHFIFSPTPSSPSNSPALSIDVMKDASDNWHLTNLPATFSIGFSNNDLSGFQHMIIGDHAYKRVVQSSQ